MIYNDIMKKSIMIMALFLVLSTVIFSQGNYRGQRVNNAAAPNTAAKVLSAEAKAVVDGIQIDVFFSVPVNPSSFSGKHVLVNSKPLSSDVKTVFNREGTQVRFVVKTSFPVELSLEGIESSTGSSVSSKKIVLDK